jgi:hydrogenase-1 operon protein HyaF
MTIPVCMAGAAPQLVEDEMLQYLPMPREMNDFRMPILPGRAGAAALRESRELLAAFLRDIDHWNPESDAHGPRIDLAGMPAAALGVTTQMLGEGEVSIRIGGSTPFRIQESMFAGIWRVCAFDGAGTLARDWLEAAALPSVVAAAARTVAAPVLADVERPTGAVCAPALVAEIEAQMRERRPGRPAHVINLTFFPMTSDDHDLLDRALSIGPVAIISHTFGKCRITSTGARDVWRVQYFNGMNTLVLNTIEIVDVPEVAVAAVEDVAVSRARLAELVDWMNEASED